MTDERDTASGFLAENEYRDTRILCVPLCGAVRAYGDRALDPSWWWKHEAQCPARKFLRSIYDAGPTS